MAESSDVIDMSKTFGMLHPTSALIVLRHLWDEFTLRASIGGSVDFATQRIMQSRVDFKRQFHRLGITEDGDR